MLLVIGRSTVFRCSTLTESDYLEVSGLAGGSSRRYCSTGDRPPPAALTTTSGSSNRSQLRLTFQSDGKFDATGFEAFYEFSTFVPSMNAFTFLRKTRSSSAAKSTARPSCLVGVPYDVYRRQTTEQLINHLYETGQETYRIPRNNAK